VYTINTMHYVEFLGGVYYLYYVVRSIFGVYTIDTTYYAVFIGLYNIYTTHYAVFSRGVYYLYYALRSFFEGQILFILRTTQYFRGVYAILLWTT